MTVLAFGEALDRMGLDIAEAVVERVRSDFVKVPSVAQLYEVARDIRDEQQRPTPRLALTASQVFEAMPQEIRDKVHAMTDPDRKRREREAEIAENNAEWERKKAIARMARRRTDICHGTGKIPIELENGMRVCPDCGVEVPDLIVEAIPEPKRRRSWRTGEVA